MSVRHKEARPVKVAAVGKSSIATRFVSDKFHEVSPSTIGAVYLSKHMVVNGVPYKFQIWDTAGQEKYRSLTPMYYRGAAAVVYVYDVTSQESFAALQAIERDVEKNGAGEAVRVVVANKSDRSDRVVPAADGEEFANSINATFIVASALTGLNISSIFESIVHKLPADPDAGQASHLDLQPSSENAWANCYC